MSNDYLTAEEVEDAIKNFLVNEYETDPDASLAATKSYLEARGLAGVAVAHLDVADAAEHAYTYHWPA